MFNFKNFNKTISLFKLNYKKYIENNEVQYEEKAVVEQDENGNIIHYKDHTGYEYWKKYDIHGNMIHCKDSYGEEITNAYDGDELTYHKSVKGDVTEEVEYNEKGRVVHYKDDYREYWCEYNKLDKETHFIDTSGSEERWTQYDTDGRKIYARNTLLNVENFYKYNDNGNCIYFESITTDRILIEKYDNEGRLTYCERMQYGKCLNVFDKNGRIIRHDNPHESITWDWNVNKESGK
jgi:hypothetical protein